MKILILGGCGYIGTLLVDSLLKKKNIASLFMMLNGLETILKKIID